MHMRSILLVAGLAIAGLPACGSDSEPQAAGGSGQGGNSASGGQVGSGGGGQGGQGGGGMTGPKHCVKTCTTPADCCAMGEEKCPGAYPHNHTCEGGLCGKPQCAKDEDCNFGGFLENFKCLTVGGEKICRQGCDADDECDASTQMTCSGADDAGTKYCVASVSEDCTTDAQCLGLGKCNLDTNTCECADAADCTAMGTYQCLP